MLNYGKGKPALSVSKKISGAKESYQNKDRDELLKIVEDFDNKKNLKEMIDYIADRLKSLSLDEL